MLYRNALVGPQGHAQVKLSDLGLSRTLSSSPYYLKTSNDKVPVKWMAPEGIFERKYSLKSDVWSYGVLCWEVYTLGEQPYPGMTAEGAVNAVQRGHRLGQPEGCPEPMFVCVDSVMR